MYPPIEIARSYRVSAYFCRTAGRKPLFDLVFFDGLGASRRDEALMFNSAPTSSSSKPRSAIIRWAAEARYPAGLGPINEDRIGRINSHRPKRSIGEFGCAVLAPPPDVTRRPLGGESMLGRIYRFLGKFFMISSMLIFGMPGIDMSPDFCPGLQAPNHLASILDEVSRMPSIGGSNVLFDSTL